MKRGIHLRAINIIIINIETENVTECMCNACKRLFMRRPQSTHMASQFLSPCNTFIICTSIAQALKVLTHRCHTPAKSAENCCGNCGRVLPSLSAETVCDCLTGNSFCLLHISYRQQPRALQYAYICSLEATTMMLHDIIF